MKPEFELGICVVTEEALAALDAHRILPCEVFDAHLSLAPSRAMNAIEEAERFLGLYGNGPITSFFHIPAANCDRQSAVDFWVQTAADRATTTLRLRFEAPAHRNPKKQINFT